MTITDRTTTPHKSPAFQFYVNDYLSSSRVQRMSMTERGVYITLLAYQWSDGSLPADLKHLAQMVGMKPGQFERMWTHGPLVECFTSLEPGRLVNERLEVERQKQAEYRRRQTDNGLKGGRPHRSQSEPKHNPLVTSGKPRALKTEEEDPSGSSSLEKKGAPVFDGQAAFARLTAAYPQHRVQHGQRVQTAFIDALGADTAWAAQFQRMLGQLESHKRSHEWRSKPTFIPNLERWLAEGLWLRQLDEEPPAGDVKAKPDPMARLREQWKAEGIA